MIALARLLAALLLLLTGASAVEAAPAKGRTTLLISIDGFRADYFDRGITPTLKALADDGVHAKAMHPSFPSLTFPNHYTLVTGLRPDEHGIVSNTMEAPDIPGVTFKLGNRDAVTDRRWWDESEPLWVSARKQGIHASTMFWPGSEAPIKGLYADDWKPYLKSMPAEERVDTVLGWLDRPKAQRPRFVTLYFEKVDVAGHDQGPDSPEVNHAIEGVDASLARLVAGLKARGLYDQIDVVVVSDHGMAYTPADHRIFLDDWISPDHVRPISMETIAGLEATPGHEAEVQKAVVGVHPHITCYNRADIPARLRYGRNPRVAPIVCIPEAGWQLTTHEANAKRKHVSLGEHGYDPASPTMNALFVAHGPDFRKGVTLEPFDNVDVYPLLAKLTGIRPHRNDGRLADLAPALKTH
ncbi:MAG: alkaline phosphatase family protein [Proteobacteria bacterium]|nr:alkaline phosphatase family protein [Pseudomonadota bacterium]